MDGSVKRVRAIAITQLAIASTKTCLNQNLQRSGKMLGKVPIKNSSPSPNSTFETENFHPLMMEIDEQNQESITGGQVPHQGNVIRLDHNKVNSGIGLLAYSNTNQALANQVKLGSDKGMLVFEPSRP
ncbi:MAG TPA: hypothetical protein V6D27_06785 [Vampirovibrionales bacterium]